MVTQITHLSNVYLLPVYIDTHIDHSSRQMSLRITLNVRAFPVVSLSSPLMLWDHMCYYLPCQIRLSLFTNLKYEFTIKPILNMPVYFNISCGEVLLSVETCKPHSLTGKVYFTWPCLKEIMEKKTTVVITVKQTTKTEYWQFKNAYNFTHHR